MHTLINWIIGPILLGSNFILLIWITAAHQEKRRALTATLTALWIGCIAALIASFNY